jgi:hypothetical protein
MPAKQGENRDKDGKFLPGASGNPNGRPKSGLSITSQVKQKLEEISGEQKESYLELITQRIIDRALEGDYRFVKLIWEHLDGTPRQALELKDGSAGSHIIILDR